MKCTACAAVAIFSLLLASHASNAFDLHLPKDTPARVFFTPGQNYLDSLISHIAAARKEILIQAYYFGSFPVAEALIGAHRKGVKVSVIVDRADRAEGVTPGVLMKNEGITVLLDNAHNLANSRVMIIDGKTLFTGSFDFNRASEERNSENLLVLESPELANLYRENWLRHRGHSQPY